MEGNGWENLPAQTAAQVLPVDAGLIPRCVQAIFSELQSTPEENYTVKCSFMEIYNEELSDLLSPGKSQVLVHPDSALCCGSPPIPTVRECHSNSNVPQNGSSSGSLSIAVPLVVSTDDPGHTQGLQLLATGIGPVHFTGAPADPHGRVHSQQGLLHEAEARSSGPATPY